MDNKKSFARKTPGQFTLTGRLEYGGLHYGSAGSGSQPELEDTADLTGRGRGLHARSRLRERSRLALRNSRSATLAPAARARLCHDAGRSAAVRRIDTFHEGEAKVAAFWKDKCGDDCTALGVGIDRPMRWIVDELHHPRFDRDNDARPALLWMSWQLASKHGVAQFLGTKAASRDAPEEPVIGVLSAAFGGYPRGSPVVGCD